MNRTLEDDLRALRDELAWPPTPDIAATLTERLTAERATTVGPAGERARWRRLPRVARGRLRVALATALLLVVGVTAVPPARSAVLDFFGLASGEQARRVQTLPRVPRRTSPAYAPGARTTLAGARARVAFPVRLPAALGAPTAVHVWRGLPGGAVILVYGDRVALWAFQGSSAAYVQKFVTPQTEVRNLRVGRARATWISASPSAFLVEDRDGRPVQGSAVLDAHVLVWRAGGVAYRLETRDGLRRALAVAGSIR